MMKRGAKRAALTSDPSADAGLQSKRVMDAPSFGVHRVESSHQHLMAGPTLDPQRAESAHQHVRALNSQFASWVQLQLQSHPDELWEDGVSDYLSHASRIMENFKDVVDWLRAKSAKQKSVSIAGSTTDENNSVDVFENNKKLMHSNISNGFAKQQTTASMPSLQKSSPQSSGLFSFSQKPDFAGSSSSQKSLFTVSESNKATDVTNGVVKQMTPASFPSFHDLGSQSSGLFSFSQKPAFSGMQGDATKAEVSGDVDDEASLSCMPRHVNDFANCSGLALIVDFHVLHVDITAFGIGKDPNLTGRRIETKKIKKNGNSDVFMKALIVDFHVLHVDITAFGIEDDQKKPSSPSLEKAEEKGIVVVHEAKCKVYVKPDDPADKAWKDMGVGHLSIKCKEGAEKATKDSRPTIVIRNDVGKILVNALIYHGIKMNIQKNTIASIFHTAGGGHGAGADSKDIVARTYLLRLKNEEETSKLATAIKDHAPSD
ncbi:RanBP1 domain containing protein [Musa troglodytarum]|uniref:RanBP1 domain containing protein n=1 Tax=Musa troglodytarum TaxID=320322 RepID=A0A9E7EM84_9LILI|nr:RanBP1 domain containing protein [Musa troglodytarum]